MSVENIKKLEFGMDMSCNCDKFVPKEKLTNEIMQELINKGGILEDAAMSSGEIDVLERAFDYFLEEENDIALANGGCETLENEIFQYFTWKQILSVLEKKLEKLIEVNLSRASNFVIACLNTGNFGQFRDIFNKIHSIELKKILLEDCDKWYGKKYPNEIELLREDVKEC